MSWQPDTNNEFRINTEVVKDYFNKTKKLMFSKDSASLEEEALFPYLNLSNCESVLDLGCGNGRWAQVLKDDIEEFVGVDFSEAFIEQAQENIFDKRFSFYCMPAEEYLSDKKFDLILVIGLLTYLNDDQIQKLAQNTKKMLASNGRLIVRNVSLKDNDKNRVVFNRKFNFLEKLLGRRKYQVIRRNSDEELSFFNDFKLVHTGMVENTGYVFYVFEQQESLK